MMPLVVVRKAKPAYVDAAVPEPALRREHAIASTHEPRFARAFLGVMRNLLTPDTKRDLLKAIRGVQAGELTIEDAVQVVPWWNPAEPLANKLWTMFAGRLESAYTDIIEDAGDSEFRAQGWPMRFEVQKAIHGDSGTITVPVNPFSIRFIRERSARLVAEASADQQALLRKILTSGFEEGRRPVKILEGIEQTVGLLEREHQWVRNRDDLLAETGMPAAARKKAVDKYAKQVLRKRAMRIAPTETIGAYSKGLEDSWQMASDEGFISGREVMKEWVELTASPRTCKICRGLARQRVPLGEPFVSDIIGEVERPPSHPHCLPGDTLVLASGVSATSERAYHGDLIIIRTASGNNLPCTPNHPVLSDTGWIAAKDIQTGSYVVSSSRSDWATPGVVDHEDYAPPVIKKISDFSLIEPFASARRVPITSHDFHGDGKGSKVAIIRAYRNLRDQVLSSMLQELIEFHLDLRDMQSFCLDCLRTFSFGHFGHFATANGIMGGSGESQPFLGSHRRVPHEHGLTPPPGLDARLKKTPSNSRAADAEGFAERLLADPAFVFADKVVSVDVQSFHGAVLNLETNTGAYIAQGVVTHNCRCTMFLVDPEDDDDALNEANRDTQQARNTLAGG